jgi:hypothetical protein
VATPVADVAEAAGASTDTPGAPQRLEPDQNPVVDLLGIALVRLHRPA